MPVEGATSAQRNIADHYQHCGGTMDKGTFRLALDHATKGRHYDTVESDVVKAIVCSHAARHVGGIVNPLKKTLIIEIKCLVSGMRRNPRWEDHAELSPGLTVLVVGLYFIDLNAGLSQQKRGREVIPERVACEVEFLKFVPLRREDGTGERISGIFQFADDSSVGVLNPNAAGSKVPRRSGLRERSDGKIGLLRVQSHHHARQSVRPAFDPPKRTVQGDFGLHISDLLPGGRRALSSRGPIGRSS